MRNFGICMLATVTTCIYPDGKWILQTTINNNKAI